MPDPRSICESALAPAVAKKSKTARSWTAPQLIELLRTKYSESVPHSGGGWDCRCFLEQVANGTGYHGDSSWIDAAVVEFWGSNGYTRRAFEVKVDRNDFLREVARREKNMWCREAFHEFWFVAPEGVITSPAEVPEGDGWMAPRGSGLTIKVQAKRREAKLDDLVVCALLRAMLKRTGREIEAADKRALAESHDHQHALAWQEAADEFIKERTSGNNSAHVWHDADRSKMVSAAKAKLCEALKEGDGEKLWRRRADELYETVQRLHEALSRSAGHYLATVGGLQAMLMAGSQDYPGWGLVKKREWQKLLKHVEGSGPVVDPRADQVIETARNLIAQYDKAKALAHA